MEEFRDGPSYPSGDTPATVGPGPGGTLNPYEAPQPTDTNDASRIAARALDLFVLFAWPMVFALNLAIPLFFGWDLTAASGRVGMIAGCVAWLMAGWTAFLIWPFWGRQVIVGAILLALSQVFPVIQVFAGLVAFAIAEKLGFGRVGLEISESGAFVITIIVGAELMIIAAAFGLLLSLVLPQRWFRRLKKSGVMT